ncbi:MAG: sugar phosphate isomerase/epimerase family protein [Nanoarchaeota archaeon]
MIPIGIMQGRLSKPKDRFQCFPWNSWREEFPLAAEAGFSCIEWIYEQPHEEENPLGTDEGCEEIRQLSVQHGVKIQSICADYYMTNLLLDKEGKVDEEMKKHLIWLIGRASKLKMKYIILPFVDPSSVVGLPLEGLIELLFSLKDILEQHSLEIHLETDLPPKELAAVLQKVDHPLIKANLDTGNSASLGFDAEEELNAIGPHLGSVHIKDRILNGGTVPLGKGDTDFKTYFRLLKDIGFPGPLILQTARDETCSELELAQQNIAFVRKGWG